MIRKTILAAIAIAATAAIVPAASAEFPVTGTATNNAEGGFGAGGYGSAPPHGQQILINHWPIHQRRE